MTQYIGKDAKIEIGPSVLHDDLAQELIKAQAAARMAQDDYTRAYDVLTNTCNLVRKLENEITRRGFEAVGVQWGKTVLTFGKSDEVLAVGVEGDTLLVHRKTVTGKWFKRKDKLWRIKPSDIKVIRHE